MKAYSCSYCGAEILTDANTGATRCPYCGNTTIIEAQFSGAAKPDYVIPFAFNKTQAMDKYKTQLRIYKAAFDLVLDKPVKSCYIYSFWLGKGREIFF